VSQIVQFRRPETPEGVSVFVHCDSSPEVHVRRMEALGYVVVDQPKGGPGRPSMRSELMR